MRVRRGLGIAALVLAVPAWPSRASAAPGTQPGPCAVHAPEAAVRSGVTVDIILRVMRAESDGQPLVRSPKGAIGCMQIMPTTWDYLAPRYDLGADAFDARMNMIGGAFYLAELQRRFGMPGAFAAYSAGPSRYLRFVEKGVPLPAETVAYVNRIGAGRDTRIIVPAVGRWQEAGLFLANAGHDRANDIPSAKQTDDAPVGGTIVGEPLSVASSTPTVASLFPLASDPAAIQR